MANEISPGPVTVLTQNVIFSLPARNCTVFSDVGLEISNVTSFTTKSTIAANTTTVCAAAYVRSTTADANVCVKVY